MSAFARSVQRIHRGVGGAMALLIAAWFASGAVMTFASYPRLSERERIALAPSLGQGLHIELPNAIEQALKDGKDLDALEVRLAMHEGSPTWLYRDRDGVCRALRAEAPWETVSPLSEERAHVEAERRFGLRAHEIELLTASDQWTLGLARRGVFPLYRIRFGDANITEAYLSVQTGELVQLSTQIERTLAWLGAIPHWIYPSVLRRERVVWRYTVLTLSVLGLFVTISGILVGLRVWYSTRKRTGIRDPYLRWHQRFGLGFGLFASSWLFSGALSLSPFHWAGDGGLTRREQDVVFAIAGAPLRVSMNDALARCQRELDVRELELTVFAGRIYAVCAGTGDETRLLDLSNPVAMPQRRLALHVFEELAGRLRNGAKLPTVTFAKEYDAYHYATHHAPEVALPYVRVDTHDSEQTVYYFDPARARLLQKHTMLTKLERWLYHGLHSFDIPGFYEHSTLWRVLLVGAMAVGFALSILGGFMALRRRWRKWRRQHRDKIQPRFLGR